MKYILPAVAIVVVLFYTHTVIDTKMTRPASPTSTPSRKCKPTFRDGGGPYYLPDAPFRDSIAPDTSNGTPLEVTGTVWKGDCTTPLPGAIIDIWQANESGNYEDEWYRGKIVADQFGSYTFHTVVPQGYGEGTGYRPPHIHFKIFDGETELVTSQMFFPESRGEPGFDDAYIITVTEQAVDGTRVLYGQHDIVLP